jgi:hypothetical protein
LGRHDLQSSGPEISHSITNYVTFYFEWVAWLKAGMADKFLVGGVKHHTTDFTIVNASAKDLF